MRAVQILFAPDLEAQRADAGLGGAVSAFDFVGLDATDSYDPDGDTLRYAWDFDEVPPGGIGAIVAPDFAVTQFQPDTPGTWTLAVTVSDAESSATDTVTFQVAPLNQPPVALAGQDFTASVGATVFLDGTLSYDPDQHAFDYDWVLEERPLTSTAVLINPTTARPSFTADQLGAYVFALEVIDSRGARSAPDRVRVLAE